MSESVDFVWMGENLGEVERVVISDAHVIHHIRGGEVKRIPKEKCNVEILVDGLHRHNVDIKWLNNE